MLLDVELLLLVREVTLLELEDVVELLLELEVLEVLDELLLELLLLTVLVEL